MSVTTLTEIAVCIGTSCHLRGGEKVAAQIVSLIDELGLRGQVTVKGAFCLEHCSEGVTVKVGDRFVDGVQVASVRERVLPEIIAQTAATKG
jgi:NADH-quinone oxidoreductase subunit G